MSKRKHDVVPLTKGAALIVAREILGPAGTVRYAFDTDSICIVGRALPNAAMTTDASGHTWEEALEAARGTSAAQAWSEQQITQANELQQARFSLLVKAKEFLKDSKFMRLLSRSEKKYVVGSLRAR